MNQKILGDKKGINFDDNLADIVNELAERDELKIVNNMPGVIVPESDIFASEEDMVKELVYRGEDKFHVNVENEKGQNLSVPISLEFVLDWARKNKGVVATLPYLIAGLSIADPNNYLRLNSHTAFSEEYVGIDTKGEFVNPGEPVVVVVHGGGILNSNRIKQAYAEGLTDTGAAKLSNDEFDCLLAGILPLGEKIELYTVDDVKEGKVMNPFGRYGVVLDFDKTGFSGRHIKDAFVNNHLVIARAGTLKYLDKYFENIKCRDKFVGVGNLHRFHKVNPSQAQGNVLRVIENCNGLNGSTSLGYDARFVGVVHQTQKKNSQNNMTIIEG